MLDKKTIEKDLDKLLHGERLQITDYENNVLDVHNLVKQFLFETISQILDDVAGEEENRPYAKAFASQNIRKKMQDFEDGYNQKREEILDYKDKFK